MSGWFIVIVVGAFIAGALVGKFLSRGESTKNQMID